MNRCKFFTFSLILLFFCTTNCYAKEKLPVEGKGYIGTLPVLTRNYVPKGEENGKKENSSQVNSIPSKDFNSENEIKPAPTQDPTFVNIILKTDKTSKYANDLNELIPILENIYDLIDDKQSAQLFNAKVYYFNKSADYFKEKYANKPEENFISYRKIMELSTHAKSIAVLRTEAYKYNPYLAYGTEGYIYNPNNIDQQLEYLKTEIQQAIVLFRDLNE